ncbi:MAG: hypothetical protein QF464_21935 [Myxococcota bacterium]|nr:hypothetical protein [Myxococcota bacterium]
MGVSIRRTLRTMAHYLRYHPATLVVFARHAAGRRVAIPLDVLRWALDQLPEGGGKPESLAITARPPSLALDATASLMGGNRLRACATVEVECVELGAEALRLTVRLHEVEVVPLTPDSPLGKMLSSGLFDFSRPASLLNFAPKRPKVIAEADGNRFVLDLLQLPRLASNRRLRRALATISPVIQVRDLRTEGDWLLVQLQTRPSGLVAALNGLRGTTTSTA